MKNKISRDHIVRFLKNLIVFSNYKQPRFLVQDCTPALKLNEPVYNRQAPW